MRERQANPFRRRLALAARSFWLVGVFSSGVNILGLTVSVYLMLVFDRVLSGHSLETLAYLTLLAGVAILTLVLLDLSRALIGVRVGAWLDATAAPEVYERSIEGTLAGHSYAQQALHDLGTLRAFVASPAPYTLFDALWMPVYLLVVVHLHWALGLVALVGMGLLIGLGLLNEKAVRGPVKAATSEGVRLHAATAVALRNAEAVDAMGMGESLVRRRERDQARMLDEAAVAGTRSALVMAGTRFVRSGMQIALLAVGAYLATRRELTGGAVIGASIIMGRAVAPVEQALGLWKQFIAAGEARRRLEAFHAAPLERQGTVPPPPRGQLSVEGVTFSPPGAKVPVLQQVSFMAEAGEMVAILGPSGAGKSCLARLLVGVWKPAVGVVRLDGADVHAWPRRDFGRHVGYVPQDVELFPGSVRDNIARMGEVSDEILFAAARLAGVHDIVLRLPQGYDTEIGDGGMKLSGGQRQRVALARAVLGRPRLVVLDEPNAGLDGDGELALAQAIDALKAQGTLILAITHRRGLLVQADKVLVLRGGQVDVFGTPAEVAARLVSPTKSALSA